MFNNFFDFSDGDFCMSTSDDMAMDMEGHLMTRMSDNTALDLETGELHMTSFWDNDDDDE